MEFCAFEFLPQQFRGSNNSRNISVIVQGRKKQNNVRRNTGNETGAIHTKIGRKKNN
jgi:hypothetical protein